MTKTILSVLAVLAVGLGGQVTPDRQYLVFLVDQGGFPRLRCALFAADGSVGPARRVLGNSDPVTAGFDLSSDGSTLVYSVPEADGRLNAFLTDFPAGSRQLQVTTRGAGRAQFSRDGNTLFYMTRALPESDPPRGALAKIPVALKSLATSGPPVQLLIEGREPPGVTLGWFDVARDGRLLTMRRTDGARRPSPRRLLVQNWRAVIGR